MSKKREDIVGTFFGKRQVIAEAVKQGKDRSFWTQCDCLSPPFRTTLGNLTKTDGCSACCIKPERKKKDLSGQTFNNIHIIEWVGKKSNNSQLYRCRCLLCGSEDSIFEGSKVKSGKISACRCNNPVKNKEKFKDKKNFIHGFSPKHSEDLIYLRLPKMIQRCSNPESAAYHRYGGRGISCVWELTKESIQDFIDYILSIHPDAYELLAEKGKYDIDRIDNDGNYEKGNIRIATKKQSARNKSNNVKVIIDGKEVLLVGAFDELEGPVDIGTVRYRLKQGWDAKTAIVTPAGGFHK